MKTIWDESARRALVSRLELVQASSPAKWGKFNATQMVQHIGEPLRAAMGEMEVAPKNGPFRNPLLRYLVIYWLPWPKGAPTAPEFIPQLGGDIEANRCEFKRTFDLFVRYMQEKRPLPHPAFGALSREHWGVLTYRHVDHHLTQFGV